MRVLHISPECYPITKVRCTAKVVEKLATQQNKLKCDSAVVIPYYDNLYAKNSDFVTVYESKVNLDQKTHKALVYKVRNQTDSLGFDLYQVKIEGLLDRENVHGYEDDIERFIAFQKVVLDWLLQSDQKPKAIHCHDSQTGLTPFMLSQCYKYESLKNIPTIFTIHNIDNQGEFSFDKLSYLPKYNLNKSEILEWDFTINPMAAGIKSCWKYTTVTPNFMNKLPYEATGLDSLFDNERNKGVGILNGIDANVWNPSTDKMIAENFDSRTVEIGKKANKLALCEKFDLDPKKPLIAFVGRLVYDKGADVMVDFLDRSLRAYNINILILGCGDSRAESSLKELKEKYPHRYNTLIGFDETVSHLIYAGADFLIMPDRFEPCVLNQFFALRYGTIPLVRSKESLKSIEENTGFEILHEHADVEDVALAISRANELFYDNKKFERIRKEIMNIDSSWENAASEYIELYDLVCQQKYLTEKSY